MDPFETAALPDVFPRTEIVMEVNVPRLGSNATGTATSVSVKFVEVVGKLPEKLIEAAKERLADKVSAKTK